MLVIIIKRFGVVYLGVLHTVADIAAKTPLRGGRMCYWVLTLYSHMFI